MNRRELLTGAAALVALILAWFAPVDAQVTHKLLLLGGSQKLAPGSQINLLANTGITILVNTGVKLRVQ